MTTTQDTTAVMRQALEALERIANPAGDWPMAVAQRRNAAISALRTALAANGWQPIETAPKDGRELILLLTTSRFPQVACSNTWWTAGFSAECKPTHWMPIPAAPVQTNGGENV